MPASEADLDRVSAFFQPIGSGSSSEELDQAGSLQELATEASVVLRGRVVDVGVSRVLEDGIPGGSPHQPAGEQVWFLRRKADGYTGGDLPAGERLYYRLHSSQGLLVEVPTGLVNPVGMDDDDPSHGACDPSLLQGSRQRIFDPVLQEVRDCCSTLDQRGAAVAPATSD